MSLAIGVLTINTWASNYEDNALVTEFIDEMVAEHDFTRAELESLFSQVERKDSILEAIARPAEKVKAWKDYRKIFVTEKRINRGVDFWAENRDALARASEKFGVPPEIIVSIIGVETHYGRITGSFRVMDALSTLAFDYPPRAKFFRKELKEFLLLAREQSQQPLLLKGSYAGAMGYGQFMPSSYRAYAHDFNGDGFTDIWANKDDAIGSVANYFAEHGWREGQPVVVRARIDGDFEATLLEDGLKPTRALAELTAAGFQPLAKQALPEPMRVFQLEGARGAEFWVGLHNFYVITRYNRSTMYALSVYQLAQEIAASYQHEVVANGP